MGRVKTEIGRLCRSEGLRRPHILAVAMLAGLPASDGGHGRAGNGVVRLAQRAADASLDGVFTVAHEVARVRAACGRRFIIVTSGVRPRAPREPGEKCLTAADAIRAGADYIVVGSAVLRAAEPAAAARELTEDIERGLRAAPRSPLELVPSRSL
jgi:orotidine-5'-phosphate decarboxylase